MGIKYTLYNQSYKLRIWLKIKKIKLGDLNIMYQYLNAVNNLLQTKTFVLN